MGDPKLPKRMFRYGCEPLKSNVNFYCFIKYYHAIMQFLDRNAAEKEILFNLQFGKLLKDGFKVSTSAVFLHYLLSRQLQTKKEHEIWIVFGGKPFRFSILEFAVATGLNCSSPPGKSKVAVAIGGEEEDVVVPEDGDSTDRSLYWSELFESEDEITPEQICKKLKSRKVDAMKRLKLACLLLVDILLLPTSSDSRIIESHVRMIKDLDVFLQHPWGSECFAFTMKSIQTKKASAICQQSMAIQGFIHGLQLVALCCIPEITSFATSEKNTKRKEIVDSEDESDNEVTEKPQSIVMRLVKELDAGKTVKVTYTLPTESLDGQDLTWSKDKEDHRVNYMIGLLEKSHNFTNASWSGGLDASGLPDEKGDNVNAKKGENKCVAPDVSPRKNKKAKGNKSQNIKGQRSENITPLNMADVQDLIDNSAVVYYDKLMENLQEFDTKFTGLLQEQDVAIKNDLKDMSDKLKVLSDQVDVLKVQQKSTNECMAMPHGGNGTTEAAPKKVTTDPPVLAEEDSLDADLAKLTSDPLVSVKDVTPSIQQDKSPTEELVTKNIMGVVNEVLGNEGAPNDAHMTEKGGTQPLHTEDAQPNKKLKVSFAPPTFSLGLTQDGVSLANAVVKQSTFPAATSPAKKKAATSPCRLRSKRKLPPVLPDTTIPATKQQNRSLALFTNPTPIPTVNDVMFEMLLKMIEKTRSVKIGQTLSVSKAGFMELWKQTRTLSASVMSNLIFFLRDRFLEDFEVGVTKPIDFIDAEFAVAVSKTYPNAKKKNYKIPSNVSKYVGKDCQWCTHVERLYCPYIIHGHWVGLCIDLSSHEITVLQPDPTKNDLKELTKELQPLAESLPFVITKCATNSEMEADMTKPFTINRYAGEWEIKRKGSHGIMTVLLLELHASTTLTFSANLDEASLINVGKNYGVEIYQKFNSPLPLRISPVA